MWQLTVPWWELVARAAIVYALLLLLIRVSGRRTLGQFTPFDLLVVMLLSESVSNALNGGDESILAGIISACTLIGLNLAVAFVTARSVGVQKALQGEPVLVGRQGEIFSTVLKKHHVPNADVEQALREADCDQADMQCAFLESDGRISILKKRDSA
jgi:uncharacterized membrane protein YcaP (DUF421 family)